MSLLPGIRIGVYEVIGPLGAGGMGEVYRARDTRLGRDVAIKALPRGVGADADRVARFEREAHLLASLNHPNIATIHGLVEGESSGEAAAFIVMELVDGESLAARIAAGPIPVPDALAMARQIADALHAAHLKGIVHRDLKPANVMVTAEGRVKVLDFGLAKAETPPGLDMAASPTFTSAGTQLGVILGTAAYMAPEQAKGKAVDKRADVWAFGCLLYEMLTARRAFAGEDVTEVVAAIMRDTPDWTRLPPKLPAVVDRYLRRCFEKNPNERVQDLGDMRLALDGAFDVPAAPPARAARSPIGPIAGIAVASALVAGAAVWALKPAPAAAPAAVRRLSLMPSPQMAIANVNHDFTISPNGAAIAYFANSAPGRTLVVRPLDSLTSTPVRRMDQAYEPFFSPDGKWIAFNDEADLTLRKVPIAGGLPVDIARVGREIRGAAWHADGTIVFATEEGLFRVPAAGGTAVAFAKPEAARDEQIYGWPQFLPGGKTIVFVIRSAGPGQDAIAVVPLAGGTPKVVIPRGLDPRWSPTGHLLYADGGVLRAVAFDVDALETRGESVPLIEGVPLKPFGAVSFAIAGDGTLAYLGSSRAVGRRLAWVDRNGARETLPAPPRGYTVPRISPDGTRIAVEIREQTPAIWIWDIARAALTRFTDGLRGDGFPAWTPDGKTIVFGSTRTGRPNVFAQAADGSGTARHLFEHARADNPVSVTPDGTQILFRRDSGLDAQSNKFDIMIGPIAGGPAKPLRATRAHEVNAEVSPDGRWLAYDSNEAGDETQVFVRPFPNVDGGRWQVSNAGGKQPAWRADGRELFYLTSDGKIAAVTVGSGASFSAGPPSVIVSPSLPPFSEVAPRLYDVTRDGRRFLVVEEGAANDANRAMTVVINFAEELKRLTTGR